jgi:hypothetical protein
MFTKHVFEELLVGIGAAINFPRHASNSAANDGEKPGGEPTSNLSRPCGSGKGSSIDGFDSNRVKAASELLDKSVSPDLQARSACK